MTFVQLSRFDQHGSVTPITLIISNIRPATSLVRESLVTISYTDQRQSPVSVSNHDESEPEYEYIDLLLLYYNSSKIHTHATFVTCASRFVRTISE